MHFYRAYGLAIASERALPFAPGDAAAPPDVLFHYAPRSTLSAEPSDADRRELVPCDGGWSLRYFNPAGRWIGYDYAAAERILRVSGNAEWEEIEMALIGVVCAVLLARQGRTLLHGACVAWNGGAVAILGDSGRGKSTLAAAALHEGARLLSEDLVVLEAGADGVAAQPGYGRISLLPDAVAALGLELARLQPRPGSTKSWIDACAEGSCAPLAALYILADAGPGFEAGAVVPLPRRAGAIELVRHLYGTAWIRPVAPSDLLFCAAMAERVPVFRLARPAGLAAIPSAARMLRLHAARL